jgi:hypothetical protein
VNLCLEYEGGGLGGGGGGIDDYVNLGFWEFRIWEVICESFGTFNLFILKGKMF